MGDTVIRAYGLEEVRADGLLRHFRYEVRAGEEMGELQHSFTGPRIRVDAWVREHDDGVDVKVKVKGKNGASGVNWASRVLWLISLYLDDERRKRSHEAGEADR